MIVSVVFLGSCSSTKNIADKDTFSWNYEVEPAEGQGREGTVLIKIWTYSKDQNVAITQAPKNAVHAVIFKGYSGSTNSSRIKGQKPLASDPNTWANNEDYFKTFFKDGGQYMKYVTLVGNGAIAPGDMIKVGKQYKIGVLVSVQKNLLRKDLEQAGIIKALGGNIF